MTTSQSSTGLSPKLSVKQILFSFTGRIPRRTYWLTHLALTAAFMILGALIGPLVQPSGEASAAPGSEGPGLVLILGIGLLYIFALWVGLALQVKRWHDRGKSGTWVLINLIPLVGAIWTLVECGFLRGTFGPNNYGEDPT